MRGMRKRFWMAVEPFDKALVTAAIEAGAEAVAVPPGYSDEVKPLGQVTTIAEDGDWQWGRDVQRVRITCKEDEAAVEGRVPTVIENEDWSIIPLENLIARTGNLIQTVHSAEEADIALQVMERGADGILLVTDNATEIQKTGEVVERASVETVSLETAHIVETRPVTMSDRCCIDTTSLLPPGVGLLVGNSGHALFLVHNENVESPYCAARPFRVNAGAVHAYVRLPGNRTKYLCELGAGDEVLACDPDGHGHGVAVGRNKIERRPMLLLVAENAEGERVSLVLQNAETIRLTSPHGEPVSVTTLRKGDAVLAHFGEKTGRHFGQPITETLEER